MPRLFAILLVGLLAAATASAQTFEVSVLIDRSGSEPGCSVQNDPSLATIEGVDARLTATVDASAVEVTSLTLQTCAAGTFDAPQTLGAAPYPVGLNNGTGGSDVVELAVASSRVAPGNANLSFAAASNADGSVDEAFGGFAGVTFPVPISSAAALLLALALGVAAFLALRRHPGLAAIALCVVTVAAWAANFMLDGEVADWTGETPVIDPAGDATAGGNRADIVAFFSAQESDTLFFRVDLADIQNGAPTAADDGYSTDEDTALSVATPGVLGNDSDPDGDAVTAVLDAGPTNAASFALNADGSFDYTPEPDFNGTDGFTYFANDGQADSAPASVTITVNAVNDAPTAQDDTATTDEDQPIQIDVLANDTDVDGSLDPATVSVTAPPSNGTTLVNATNGVITYTKSADFNGTDSFVYQVCDDGTPTPVECATATVTVTIDPVNDAPVADDGTASTDEDTPVTITLTGSDVDGDPLTFSIDGPPANGAVGTITQLTPTSAEVVYTPNADFNGSDAFTFTVNDGTVDSAPATIAITVDPVNDAPTADDGSVATDEDTPVTITLTGSDVDGDPLTFAIDGAPGNGALGAITQLTPTTAEVTYTPNPDFNGSDAFTFIVNDGTVDSAPATIGITIDPVNDPPTANDDSFTVDEDSSNNALDVLANDDAAPDSGETLTITGVGTPDQGGSVSTDGATVTYTPASDFVGTETFTYTIGDGNGGSDSATVTVMVPNTNMDAPACSADSASTDEDTPTLVDVLANDSDADPGQTATLTVSTVDTTGTTGVVVNNGTDVTYDPNGQFESLGAGDQTTDTFSYTAQDTDGLTCMETVTVTITGVDDPAVTANDTYRTVGNTLLEVDDVRDDPQPSVFATGSVLANDSDPDNALSVTGTSNVTAGAIVNMAADGTFTYVPPPGLRGDGNPATADDTFDYQLSGGETATVSIDIDGLVWYVDNTSNGGTPSTGTGTSADPFSTLGDGSGNADPDDAEDATVAGDLAYVLQGDGTTANQNAGYAMEDGERLLGQGVDLVVGLDGTPTTLFTGNPADRPSIGNAAGNGVSVLADAADRNGVEIRGLGIDGSDNAVDVTSANTFAVDVVIADNFIAGSGAEGLDFNPGSSGAFFATVSDNAFATSSATGNAVDVTTAVASGDVNVAIDNNTDITSSGAAGIVLDNTAGGGTLFVVSFSGNTVHGNTAGDGIRVVDATFDANPADPDFTGDEVTAGNTTVGSSINPVGGSALVLTNVAGDLAFATLDLFTDGASAEGLRANGSGLFDAAAGTGFEITNTGGTIDSANGLAVGLDPLTAGLTFASVSSGNSPVAGILLTDVAGTFQASGGSITTSGIVSGPSIWVDGGSVDVTYDGPITSNDGHSVRIENMTGGTVSLSGAIDDNGTGVLIAGNDAATSVTFSGGIDLETSTNDAFTATGAGTISVTGVNSKRVATTSGRGVNVDGPDVSFTGGGLDIDTVSGLGFFAGGGGTVEVTGTGNTINSIEAQAVQVETTIGAGGMTFDIVSAGNTTAAPDPSLGIRITNPGPGNFTANGGVLESIANTALELNGGSGDFTYAGTVRSATNSGVSVSVNNHAGGTVSLTGPIVRGRVFLDNNDLGAGTTIHLSGGLDLETTTNDGFTAINGGTVIVSGLNTKRIATTSGRGVNINGTDVSFTGAGLDIDTVSGLGFFAGGGGTVEVTGSGNTINTIEAQAVQVETTIGAGGMTFDTVSAGNTTAAPDPALGIRITNPGAGNFTANGGVLENIGTTALELNSGSGNFSYGGTVRTADASGVSVAVNDHAGGTVSITGPVVRGRVFLDNNDLGAGTTIQLTGGLDLETTTNDGFTAINGGTVIVSGANTKRIVTTSGRGVNINGTDVSFTGGGLDIDTTSGTGFSASGGGTVNVAGAGNSVNTTTGTGINIANTTIGAGGVTWESVSVNGAVSGIILSNAGSGGGFHVVGDGATGAGITVNNDSGGTIQNTTGDGVQLTNVGNVNLAYMRVQDAADHGIDADRVTDLTIARTNLVSNGSANQEHGLRVLNGAGTIQALNVLGDGNFDSHLRVFNQTGNDLTLFRVADSTLQNVTTGTFEDGISFEAQTGVNTAIEVTGSIFDNHDGDHVQATTNGTTNATVTLTNNTMTGTATNLGAGITVNSANSYSGTTNFTISNNTIRKGNDGSTSINVNIGSSTASGSYTGTISNNIIGTTGVPDSAGDTGIAVQVNQDATMTVAISNNELHEFDNNGILVSAVDGNGTMNATVTSNTASSPDTNVFAALFVDAQTNNTVCIDAGGASVSLFNTFSASGGFADVALRTGGTGVINLEGYGGPADDQPAIQTYVQNRNDGTPSVLLSAGGTAIQGGGSCPTP